MPDIRVERIDRVVAKPFIERWHYSRICPTGKNIFFGAFLNDELYAVADYGTGANMDQGASLSRYVSFPLSPSNHIELKRLCRAGEVGDPKIPLTRFLSICHRKLKAEGFRFVFSYSETDCYAKKIGNKWYLLETLPGATRGGIYRAANFKNLGQTAPVYHTIREADGKIFHRRVAYRGMKRWNAKHPDAPKTIGDVRLELGLVPIVTPPKTLWGIIL